MQTQKNSQGNSTNLRYTVILEASLHKEDIENEW